MAKNFKRSLALVLALALCAGQLALPVSATDSSITTPVEGGTQTVTITTDSSGTQTTTTEVSTSNPDTGTSHQSTTTEVVSSSSDGSSTSVDTTWDSTTVQTGSDTEPGNPTVQTDTNVTTTVTGSETATQSSTHHADGSETIEGSIQGEEETTITGTTVTTTTTTDVLLSQEDSSTTNTTTSSDEDPSSTGWVQGEVTEGQWQNGQVQQGNPTTVNTSSSTTEIDASNPGKATIHMDPDGKTNTVKVDVTIDQVLAGVEIPEGATPVKEDGKTIGYKIVSTETSSTTSSPTVGETTETPGAVTQTPTAPKGYTEGTVTEGNVTTVTEAIREGDKIIGYRVTKTTVTEAENSATTESNQETSTDITTGETSYTLPQRPEEKESTDAAGYVTKTLVEDILEDGKVVGYKSITTFYTPDGETMRTETSSIYGTTSSSSTQVQKDPETEVETVKTTTTKTEVNEIFTTVSTRDVTLVTERINNITTTIVTEEDTYQLVETEDGLFFLYKGTMQPVVALSGHGTVDLEGLKPTAQPSTANDLARKTGISKPPTLNVDPGAPGSDQFKYIDYGLISNFKVTKDDGNNTSEVHLYKLVDKDGNPYYAYCADLDTTAYRKTIYDISNAKDENYYQNNTNQDAYAHLQAIAISGYWGTSSGTGSIAAIKTMLDKAENRAYLKSIGYTDQEITKVINSLTDGEAMTATQAAIWTFGNKSSSNLVNTNNPAANVSDKTSKRNIEALYDLLISDSLKNNTKNEETDIIQEQDITGATLELKGKVTDNSGEVVTDSKGNEKYKADLTFTLSVEESALTGNLKVVVKDQNGKKLCDDIQLLTENSNFLGKALADGSGYSYTIENLEIAEGVTINLNLEGYQNLKKGVYIYTAASGSHKDSQTFIGIAEGKRDVKLGTSLTFTVEDPQLEHVEKSKTQTRKDTRVDRKEDHRTDTKEDTVDNGKITVTVVTDTNVKAYGTETVTETKQDITKESRSWETNWRYDLKPIDGDDGNNGDEGDDTPDQPIRKNILKKNLLIPDEKIPLAKAPKTGDLSGIWAVISGLSLGGVTLLNRKRKEEA